MGRFSEKAAHVAPTVSSAASRVVQLLLLGAITTLFAGPAGDATIVAFVLLGSIAQLTDSGGLAYLLVHHRAAMQRGATYRVALVQVVTVGLGLVVGLGLSAWVIGVTSPIALLTIAALGLAQLLDGVARVVRAQLLISNHPLAFAAPEVLSTAGRLVVIGLAWSTGAAWVLALCLLPALVSLVVSASMIRSTGGEPPVHVTVRAVLAYGVSGLASIFLAQAPLLVASLLLPAASAAPLSVAYRVAQAAEFVPATLAQQTLPRLVQRPERGTRFAVGFFVLGAAAALAIWLLRDVIGLVIDYPVGTLPILAILLLALPFRFTSHLLISLTFALGLVSAKAWMSAGLGVLVSIAVAVLCVSTGDAAAVAVGASLVEVLQVVALTALIVLTLRIRRRRGSLPSGPRPGHAEPRR